MAFPNVSDIIASTLEARGTDAADNVTDNIAFLAYLKKKGNTETVDGGRLIYEDILFAENPNGGYYSGYDVLPTGPADVLSAAEYNWSQIAVPVVISGRELMMNSGEAQVVSLIKKRIQAGDATMMNIIEEGLFSDGTGSGGKQITGLLAVAPVNPATGIYGGINRGTATNAFWRSQLHDPSSTPTVSTIQAAMTTLWASCVRGSDRPDLIIADSLTWALYMGSLQLIQRFTEPSKAQLGFNAVKFMDADVVLGGGIGGNAPTSTMYFLNLKYLHWKPHAQRNIVPLEPGKRSAFNQDASVQIQAFMGNLTCDGARYQGRGKFD